MTCKHKILCLLSIAVIIVTFLNGSGTPFLLSSKTGSSELVLTVQTEQPYYGFGEVVKICGNLTDTNGTAIKEAKIAIEVKNPHNNTIFLDIVFSTLNGMYQDNFRLDNNTALGQYYVHVTANIAGYLPTSNQTIFTVVTMAILAEKSFSESTHNETLLSHQTIMNGVTVSGNLSGTLNFTRFEIINITTGSFAGKGLSKGEWEATLEGIPYSGSWSGALFLAPSERKIHLKGAIAGEISGVVEGYITETVNGSGVYDHYQATWKIGRLRTTIVSATIYLNGSLIYENSTEYPNTELYILQTSVDGFAVGHYNCSLSFILTQIRILNNHHHEGEGFSIISYSSNYGMGEGWTYDRLASLEIVKMNGFLTSPLYGVLHATLDETTLPRTLHIYLERVDLGLPPMADLKIKIWGPEWVSPGQTITYGIELRNDGLKSAENVTLFYELPWAVDYLSSTDESVYKKYFREVDWQLSLPAKGKVELATQGKIMWGLEQGTFLEGFVKLLEEMEIATDPTIETRFEITESNETYSKVKYSVFNQSMSVSMDGEISITEVSSIIAPTIEVKQIAEGINEIVCSFVVKELLLVVVSFTYPVQIGAATKTADFLLSCPGYKDEIRKFKANEDLTNDLYTKGYDGMKISEDAWERLHVINEGEFILKTFFKGLAKLAPVFGGAVSKLSYDIPISSIASHYRSMVIAIDNLDLYFALVEMYAHRSQVRIASTPEVKYGFEGYVSQGQTLNYTIEYWNDGEGIAYGVYFTDVLDEDLNDSTLEIGPVISRTNGSVIAEPGTYNPATRTITWLVGETGPSEGGIANFTIKVKNDVPEGTEIINFATVYFPSVPETRRTNTIISVVGHPNIAITGLIPFKTTIAKGSILYLSLTLANEGYFAETFNITIYANSTVIKTQNITTPGRSEDTILLTWNTTDFAYGNYTIWAYAWPVPGETNTDDNTFFAGWVVVASHDWELDFIPPTEHPIVDFAVYNGSLYAAADNKLYVHDGTGWNIVDAPAYVVSLETFNDKLVVGARGGLYCYDGTSFTHVFAIPTYIKTLGVYNGTLYAGTILDNPPVLYYCNGSPENLANWHIDTSFSSILNFSGSFGSIDSFTVYDCVMYVSSGGKLYSFNGSNWSVAVSFDDIYAFLDMQVYNDKLYLATRDHAWRKPMYQGGTGFSGRIIEYDGENWTTIFDHDYWIYSLETYNGKLYAGTANRIFIYNGTHWDISFYSEEGVYHVISLIAYDGKIYAGMGNGYIFVDPSPETMQSETIAIPEFSSFIFLPLFIPATLVTVLIKRRKRVS